MIIEITTGKETFTHPSFTTTINSMYIKDKTTVPISWAEATKISKACVTRHSNKPGMPASRTNLNRGIWYVNNYNVPEESFIDINIRRTDKNAKFGLRFADIMLRTRDTAAYVRLGIKLAGHPDATTDVVYFEGRFDVLTPERIKQYLGIKKLEHYKEKYREDFVTVQILEPQRKALEEAKSVIKTKVVDGKKKLITLKKRKLILE